MQTVDVFIIGGGINGCGIARDAAGRGLSVALAEKNDLGSATSSASTKLFHGGLRYLEYFEFRLVREALIEREVLLRAMPHISWPMRFVLPYHGDMRFESDAPTSRLLSFVMPWMKGRRPAWLIRLGLFMYDHLGGRDILKGTTSLDLSTAPEGGVLKSKFKRAFEYSDCWVQDSRLVVLNARDAAKHGAKIMTKSQVVGAQREGDLWRVTTQSAQDGSVQEFQAKVLVNAAGPWVTDVANGVVKQAPTGNIRLVRGSHIVTRRLFEGDKCYFFQGEDGRIVFAIPYERDFTLIGTTDVDHESASVQPKCTDEEMRYLIDFVNNYFNFEVLEEDVVWRYSGVRPLYNDGQGEASAATRDYTLKLDAEGGAPQLTVFGGKITTYRKLSEAALQMICECLPGVSGPWTAGAPLPGGNFAVAERPKHQAGVAARYPFLTRSECDRLFSTYGTEVDEVLQNADERAALGEHFGAGLYECEVIWMVEHEYAQTAEDVMWRRSKLGLHLTEEEQRRLAEWFDRRGV
ncbi:MAG: glycerol-3-phosphate dehydrogenase [Pelagimonas sp.]|jgi:glycerol-3-phosphate dehydrogenase|nr:glycerol-3-phosphate dehydrogenase [Pelagimonas sp.]